MLFFAHPARTASCLYFMLLCGLPVATLAQQHDNQDAVVQNLAQLTDAAETTLQKQAVQQPAVWISDWLADAPVLSASLLQSQTTGGSDEVELALTLPLKSPSRLKLDASLEENEQRLTTSLLAYRRWHASGLVRDIIWTIQLEQTKQRLLNEQVKLYQGFINKLEASRRNEVDAYHYYLYKQSATELELDVLASQQRQIVAQQQLHNLTGQNTLPGNITETEAPHTELQQHPRLQLLLLQAQQLQLQLEASFSANTSWQLTTNVKHVDTPGFNDKQIGLRLDIPLSFGNQTNQQDSSAYKLAYQEWLNSYGDAQREIQQQYQTARNALNSLKQQRALLSDNDALRKAAKASVLMLLERQEISPDLAQQRLQQFLQADLQLALVDLQVQHAIATLNQHAGVML